MSQIKKSKEKKLKKTNNFQRMLMALSMEIREHKSSFFVYMVLRVMVILVMILQIFNRNYENVFLCILTLGLLVVPGFLQIQLRIEIPTTLEIFMLLFIFAAEILGEIREYYLIIPMWDTMLHTINGFLAAAIGFSLVDILNRNERFAFQLSSRFMALVAFCFSMTIGVLWEFFEFSMDILFQFDMQKDTVISRISSVMLNAGGKNHPVVIDQVTEVLVNGKNLGLGGYLDIGLVDTMKDLIVNFIGAIVFSIIGYYYVKHRGKGGIARRFIPRLKKREADFLTMVEEKENKKYNTITAEGAVKTIIFDIGNVLMDFNYQKCFRNYTKTEEEFEAMVKATVKSETWREFDRGVLGEEEMLNAFIQGAPALETQIREMFSKLEDIVKTREYTVPWIKELRKKGYQVLFLSNFPEKVYRIYRDEMAFLEEMDGGILSYREKLAKPERPIYELLVKRYGLNPKECVYLDDLAENLIEAQNLGMHVILFESKDKALLELKKIGVR